MKGNLRRQCPLRLGSGPTGTTRNASHGSIGDPPPAEFEETVMPKTARQKYWQKTQLWGLHKIREVHLLHSCVELFWTTVLTIGRCRGVCGYGVGKAAVMANGVVVELAGGLGSQLFQWATGYAVSERLGVNLELESKNIPRPEKSLDKRKFELDYFSIRKRRAFLARFWRKRWPAFQESGFLYDRRIDEVESGSTLVGYFSSWRYFEDCASKIRAILQRGAKPSKLFLELSQKLEGKVWIGVHVRRGDFLNFPEIFPLADSDYYSRALDFVGASSAEEIVVFSTEVSDGRSVVPQGTIYVDASVVSEPGDVVMLLSKANHVVGANSSLSWWGAYLNEIKGAKKVFPLMWFGPKGWPTDDLIPANWTRM